MKTAGFIIFLILGYITIAAQTDVAPRFTNEEITEQTSKLAMKLLLNEKQSSGIEELLKSYRSELDIIKSDSGESKYKDKQELIASINKQIESLLDSKQKMKYDVLKKEWWASIESDEND
jgi:hypothetical protein